MDEAIKARLIGLFFAEAREGLERMNELLPAFADVTPPELVADFGGVAHGLKGAAASLGIESLAAVLHGLEELALERIELASVRVRRHRALLDVVGNFEAALGEMESTRSTEPSTAALNALRAALNEGLALTNDAKTVAPQIASQVERAPIAASGDALPSEASHAVAPSGETTRTVAPSGEATLAVALPGEPTQVSTRPIDETRAVPSQPRAGSIEQMSVPSGDVDQALALASQVARSAAALQERLVGSEGPEREKTQELVLQAERLEALLVGLRMVNARLAFEGLDAEVAQLCARLGKQAQLTLSGADVRADRGTLNTVKSLVRHLVRNAIDHGLEAPESRRTSGKSAVGHLQLSVEANDARLTVRLEDDGRGFDLAAIRRKLAAAGHEAAIDTLSDADVLQLFASEGGSTREAATDISGRGLGLSAVARHARGAGGDFRVTTQAGQGSVITLSLPLQVYAAEVLTVLVSGQWIGVPAVSIERTVFLQAAEAAVQRAPTGDTLAIDERIIPLWSLADPLGLTSSRRTGRFAIVVQIDAREAAFEVEELGTSVRVVPKTVKPTIDDGRLISAVALLPDGAVLQIVNPRRLLSEARTGRRRAPQPASRARSEKLEVLLAEDSRATREVLRVLLEQEGFRVRIAADGAEALERLEEGLPDVLVSDVNMPNRDGLSLTRAVRASRRTAHLPVILLTSQDDPAVEKAGRAAGANAYLIKSRFNAALLRTTLAGLGVEVSR